MSDSSDQPPTNETPESVDLDGLGNVPDPLPDGYTLNVDGIPVDATGRLRCGAKARNHGGRPCLAKRIKDATRCRMHGGTSPAAKAKAAQVRTEREIRETLKAFGLHEPEAIQDPLTALREIAGEIIAWKDAMREEVLHLKTLSFVSDYGETAKAVVQLFERAMDRAVAALATIAKLNIDERLAAISESQAKQLEDGLFDALDEAGVPVADVATRKRVAVAFGRHLSVVPG